MAKIVQVITRPEQEYNLQVAEAQVRDLDAIVEKLEEKRQEKIREMQDRNRSTPGGAGGYQAGYGRDFMDGPSGTIGGQNQGLGGQQGKAGGTATMGSS